MIALTYTHHKHWWIWS